MLIRKNEIWHSYPNFRYIKVIYSERWFNFIHFMFFTQCKMFCISISKNTSKLRDAWFFRFLLHLTCTKRSLNFLHTPWIKRHLLQYQNVDILIPSPCIYQSRYQYRASNTSNTNLQYKSQIPEPNRNNWTTAKAKWESLIIADFSHHPW